MKQECYPISVVTAVPFGEGIRFLHPKEKYDISGFTEIIWAILSLCDGYREVKDIVREVTRTVSGSDVAIVKAVIEDLLALGVLADSREVYRHFHGLSNNPMPYSRNVSFDEIREYTASKRLPVSMGEVVQANTLDLELQATLHNRQSCRSFSDDKLTADAITTIMLAGYSVGRHNTPSAGGLYPLKVYLIVTRDQVLMPEGYYEYDPERQLIVRYENHVDNELLQFAFDNETLLFNAPVIVVIAADINRQPGKYSNRGYRYTLIEAGHVAQNILLAATELGIASLEYGGFLDDVLAEELGMDKQQVSPLISVALGKASDEATPFAMHQLEQLENELVGPTKPIRYVRMISGGKPDKGETFFGASALYKPSPNQDTRRSYSQRFAGGTATSSGLAQVKALAEAYERYASSLVRVDRTAKAEELDERWIDPRIVAPLSSEQYASLPFLQPFNPQADWQWVQGETVTSGTTVWVPVDLVYYPLRTATFNRRLCFEASSSGVAAYTTHVEAEQRALLELIERDCVIRNWFYRTPPKRLSHELLPYHWQRRVAYWHEQGREVHLLDMSDYGVITINVVIVAHDQYPCFVNGSASSLKSLEEAAAKAFHEAELGLLQALKGRPHKPIDPSRVVHPMDHAKLYALPQHLSNIEWLWQGDEMSEVPAVSTTARELHDNFDTVKVRLSPPASSLKVVRILSEKLVPINFGFGTEHHLHQSVEQDRIHADALNLPHYFA